MSKKEMAKVEGNKAVTASDSFSDMGFTAEDITIPKILLMQGLSDMVAEGTAAMGDIVDSVTGSKLGDKKDVVEVIPFKGFKTWVISLKPKGAKKFEFKQILDMNASNEKMELEVTHENGDIERRDRCINFYVVSVKDIAEGEAFPYLLSLRRTSMAAGKNIVTSIMKASIAGKDIFDRTQVISCVMDKNDLGTFYRFTSTPGRPTTEQEKNSAKTWLKILATAKVKIDNSDLVREAKEVDNVGTVNTEF